VQHQQYNCAEGKHDLPLILLGQITAATHVRNTAFADLPRDELHIAPLWWLFLLKIEELAPLEIYDVAIFELALYL
jgi:hypothetical protein